MTSETVREPTPTAAELVAALGSGLYRPAGKRVALVGVLWQPSDRSPSPHKVDLSFRVGRRKKLVRLSISRRSAARSIEGELIRLVFELHGWRRIRYPLVVERSTSRMRLAGRKETFTTYISDRRAIATTERDGLTIEIICSARRLARLELVKLDLRAVNLALDRIRKEDGC